MRSLDQIECLPEVVRVVQRRVPVFLDGGVRSGADVLKAIALGADQVFIGRPYIYGLSLGVSGACGDRKHAYRVPKESSTSSDCCTTNSCSP